GGIADNDGIVASLVCRYPVQCKDRIARKIDFSNFVVSRIRKEEISERVECHSVWTIHISSHHRRDGSVVIHLAYGILGIASGDIQIVLGIKSHIKRPN